MHTCGCEKEISRTHYGPDSGRMLGLPEEFHEKRDQAETEDEYDCTDCVVASPFEPKPFWTGRFGKADRNLDPESRGRIQEHDRIC